MSIDWAAIKATASGLVATLTGLPDRQIRWRDEAAAGTWGNVPMIYLRISSITDVGFADERRDQPSDPTADAIVTVTQQKRFVLSIRCESFTQDIASPDHAGTIIGTLKTRLQRHSTVFSDSSMAILLYGDAKWFNYIRDGRQVCVYTLDLTCGTVDSDVDTTPGAGNWIKEVQIQGTVDSDVITLDVKG